MSDLLSLVSSFAKMTSLGMLELGLESCLRVLEKL